MVLPHTSERVWDDVNKPEQLARWFGVVSDMDFRVGGAIQFTWENERCPYPGVIEVIEPEQRFAFRWPSYAVSHPRLTFPPAPCTFLQFTLHQRASATLLPIVQSCFPSLP